MAAARPRPRRRARGSTPPPAGLGFPLLLLALLALALLPAAYAQQQPPQTVGDRWPEFEVPPIPEDKDGTQIRLSRIRDGYLAVNTRTDPAITAELLIGDALSNKGFTPEQVFAVQQVVGLLVKAGVVELHAEKLAAASQSMGDSATAPAAAAPAGNAADAAHRRLQGCCPCVEPAMGHHPKPGGPLHYSYDAAGADKQQVQQQAATALAPASPPKTTRKERVSMYKTMKAVGLALRRAAAARSFYLYLTEGDDLPVHSYEEFGRLSEQEQEETRREVVSQLLLTCRQYGLSGAQLQKYAAVAGVEIPDLSDASKSDLKELGADLASRHAMEKVAWAMGEDMGWEAARAVREQVGDAMLRRIGVEPSPELDVAFAQFYAEAQRFANLSRKAAESQGLIEKQEAEDSFLNVTRTADRIAKTMEGVNVTDVLLTATELMVEAEPYLNEAIENPVDPATRGRSTEPWRIILKLSALEKEMNQQRRSFTVSLKPDNALDGLLALNASGAAADNPLMRELNMTAIAEITADGAMDVDELKYLVDRVGALNEVYDVDQFEALMRQVEENYKAMHPNLAPATEGAAATAKQQAPPQLQPQPQPQASLQQQRHTRLRH